MNRASFKQRRAGLARLGAVALTGTALVAAAAGCGGGNGSVAGGYTVRAIFDSASFITKGLDVKIAGVSVGSVTGVDLTPDNQAAVTFVITRAGFQDLRKDAQCTIRPQALIGERYIECTLTEQRPDGATAPAELPAIANGPYKGEHLLPVSNTAVPVDSDEFLDINNASVRERFGIIIRELGTAVAGRGDEIAAVLRKSNTGLQYTNQILKQLSEQQTMLKQLVSSSDQTLASLASERSSLTGTVENGAVVAATLAKRKDQLKGSITALNKLLTEVPPTVDRVTDLTDELQPIADDLNRSSGDLATILDLLPDVADRGTDSVKALGPTVNKATSILTSSSNDALFDRLVKTSAAVKTSAGVLGYALGDFRATGGLDYLFDTIYGLAYSLNGRDQYGYYLRGALLNFQSCGAVLSSQSEGCIVKLSAQAGGLPSAKKASTEAAATTPTETTPSDDAARASLLLGGKQ